MTNFGLAIAVIIAVMVAMVIGGISVRDRLLSQSDDAGLSVAKECLIGWNETMVEYNNLLEDYRTCARLLNDSYIEFCQGGSP